MIDFILCEQAKSRRLGGQRWEKVFASLALRMDMSPFRAIFVDYWPQNHEILPVRLVKRLPGMNSIIAMSKLYKLEAMEYDTVDTNTQQIHIGHYILGKTIGKGGFAKVKQARHELTNLPVAVKIINKLKMKNKNMISKVKRQIKILKFINHPNIIKLYQVLDTTNDIFVVMEMAKGGELYEYIQKHRLTQEDVKLFFRQIIQGVEYAHLNLVCHRDLKPQNILLDNNKIVKIADFGLSNLMKDGKLLKTSCGSLNYAAPEIIGHRYYEGTSLDVWSCGVILFTMLVGSLPFDEEIVSLLYKKIEKAQYSIPDFVSPLASDLINRMLQVNPVSRIKISEIKLHPWLRKQIPIYAKLSSFSLTLKDMEFKLDEEILNRVKAMNMDSLKSISDIDRIKKTIKKKMDDSFVTVYELLKDQKQRTSYYEQYLAQRQAQPQKQIFLPVANKPKRSMIEEQPEFVYGRCFKKTSKIIIQIIFDIFLELQVEYIIKNNQYCVLCTYYPPQRKLRRKSSSLIEDKIYGYQDEHRFTKNQIRFTLQLYAKPNKNGEVVVDLKLTQGHPLVFIPFCKTLYSKIDKALAQ